MCSLVPRPSLTAFFAAVETHAFSTAAKKAVREGLGTRLVDVPCSARNSVAIALVALCRQ